MSPTAMASLSGSKTGGAIATSPDGLNWKPVLTNISLFQTVAFGGGVFVAVNIRGGHYTSTNGVHWEPQGAVNSGDLFRIRYMNGLFVATGREYLGDGKWAAVLYTSTDGRQLIRRLRVLPPLGTRDDVSLNGVAYGNGRFLVVGFGFGSGRWNAFIYTSTDGMQWAPADPDPPLSRPEDIAFAGSGFVLFDSNRILTSADGVSWQLRHQLDGSNGRWGMRGMASVGNRVVCLVEEPWNTLGTPRVALASDDGISWHETPMPGAVDWHLFSDSTTFYALSERSALSSPDGIAWTEHFTPHPLDADTPGLLDVAYGSEGFVAVGVKGTILTSGDGASWEKRASGTGQSLTDVIHAGARYVAAGSGGALIHSSDGQSWTPANLEGVTLRLGPLAYGGDRFVLLTRSAGNGFYWTSDDGIDWQPRFSEALSTFAGFSSMAFGNGRFVAGGARGAVAVSEDGIAWQRVLLSPHHEGFGIYKVIFDGERFLAKSFDDGLLASEDGLNWTTLNSSYFFAIGHGDGNLVGLREVSGGRRMISASPDGAAWTTVAPFVFWQSDASLTFAYGAGRFVGVGGGEGIGDNPARLLISGVKPPLLDLRNENAKLMLRIDGAAGSNWTLQHSATLQDWQTVGPLTLGTEPLEIDVTPSTETHGFWRLAEPEQ